ncbi:MAG: hypothetical protein JNK66_04740 [Chitinophagales bacterium]|nr:hypothetical protein [Chitinophagales bacterium]
MKQKLLTFLLATLCMSTAYTQGFYQTGQTGSSAFDDGTNVGIGTIYPSGKLHVLGGCSGPNLLLKQDFDCQTPGNYIEAAHTEAGPTTVSDFIVNHKGQVGIGISPAIDLHISTKGYNNDLYSGDILGNLVYGVEDQDERILMIFTNVGDANEPGGCMLINSRNDILDNTNNSTIPKSVPAFGVVNSTDERINFGIFGNGAIATGYPMDIDMQTFAQFDMRALPQNFSVLMNIDQPAPTQTPTMTPSDNPYFRISSNGNIGIGIAPNTNSTVVLYDTDGSTTLDITRPTTGTSAIRFMNPANTGQPRHLITEINGDFVIDPGVANGGGNDKLVVSGSLGVRRNGTDDVYVDLVENKATPDWNAQLRWVGNTGNARHIITEEEGNLLVDVGHNGNANDKLKVAGNAEITGTVQIGNVSTPCTTNSCYSLYVEKGILAERFKCAIKTTGDWSDYVFDKDYKLMPLSDVEKFVKKNKHLPGIPSAQEVTEQGIDLAKMNAMLLAKIEELTLHLINLEKQLKKGK